MATPVSFAEYLEAKFDLDERSLNREVGNAFWQALRGLPHVECLDVGAGTGATARRLLNGALTAPLSLTALDRDPALLDVARENVAGEMRVLGLQPRIGERELQADGERSVAVRFVASDLKDYRPDRLCNVITAHAFLDIVPLADTLRLFASCLQPGGVLYATLNYDGDTALLPVYDDADFEASVLGHYDDTMEQRRVNEMATGGARCGRRLHRLLPDYGFEVLACGSSDWNITPLLGEYRSGDARCLEGLLDMIEAEAQSSGLFKPGELARWREDRNRLLHARRLGMIVHQLDVLAQRSA